MTNQEIEQVFCEHINHPTDYDAYIVDPYGATVPFKFMLGERKILYLCSRCRAALAYEMVTQFNIDSTPKHYVSPYTKYKR